MSHRRQRICSICRNHSRYTAGERDFHGETRSNETHRSTTDDDARLYRKGGGQASQLCFIGHVLMENRNGLAVDAALTRASGEAERLAAIAMAENLPTGHKTLGADKGYDAHDFVIQLRELGTTPHVAQNAHDTGTARRRSAIDGRTTRHDGYALSQKKRKRIEEIFGWLKTIGGLRQTKFRSLDRVRMAFTFVRCLQSHPHPEAVGGEHMNDPTNAIRRLQPPTMRLGPLPPTTGHTLNHSKIANGEPPRPISAAC